MAKVIAGAKGYSTNLLISPCSWGEIYAVFHSKTCTIEDNPQQAVFLHIRNQVFHFFKVIRANTPSEE